MSELKIKTGDGVVVPGKEEAERKKATLKAEQEHQANSLFADPKSKKTDYGPDYGAQRIRLHKKDEINIYADAEDARHALDPRTKKLVILGVVLVAFVLLSAVMPIGISSYERFDHTLNGLLNESALAFQGLISTLMGHETMYTFYLMSVIAAVIAGAALGVSGGVYQGALKNALASPSTLGVMSGGTLGLVIYAVFLYPHTIQNFNGQISEYTEIVSQLSTFDYICEYYGGFICALIGCFLVVGLIMIMAVIAGRGHLSNASLIIAGQVFSAVIGVVITWVRLYLMTYGTADQVEALADSQTVCFSGMYTVPTVAAFAIPIFICLAVVFAMSGRLSLLAFKDEEARSMGISTTFTRNLMVALCTIMTALVVSFCGPIGYVGFIVPHVARHYVGPDFRFLLPACAMMGSILVAGAFVVADIGLPGVSATNTGFYISILGSVMLIVMVLRQRGSNNGQWF